MSVDLRTLGAHMGDEVAWGMALAAHRRELQAPGTVSGLDPSLFAQRPQQPGAELAAQMGATTQAVQARVGSQAARGGGGDIHAERREFGGGGRADYQFIARTAPHQDWG